MKYNFDKPVDRRNTGSIKWEVGKDELPMWVADMDFESAPEIKDAVLKCAGHGVYGYTYVTKDWYEAYQYWWETRHGFSIEKKWLLYADGVIPVLSGLIRRLSAPGENVVIQTPVYNHFFYSIRDNGRNVLEAPLRLNGDVYEMDFESLEKALSRPDTTLMILCNPQNPTGNIWDREDLSRVGELCKKHHVTVISDEIHCDMTEPGLHYIPFASVSDTCREISITCVAPSKTFNIAGLKSAGVIVPNEGLRDIVKRTIAVDDHNEANIFSVPAAVAAYRCGAAWLDELREYIAGNRAYVTAYIKENIPGLCVISGKATYLMWLDARKITGEKPDLARELRMRTGLYLSEGADFGAPGFLRLNIACPRSYLEDAMTRLKQGMESFS